MLFRRLFVPLALLCLTTLFSPPPTQAQSFNYAEDCVFNVDNASIHIPASDSLSLPDDTPVETNDTLAVYTDEGTCAGYGVWEADGVTFAAAGPSPVSSGTSGYSINESLKFEIFDISTERAVILDTSVTYASCTGGHPPICREDGKYENGTIHQVSDFGTSDPLPVELVAFTASLDSKTAIVKWRTASETNNAGFEVQHRPPDASGFSEIDFVDGTGTSTKPRSYRARVEDLASGLHRFRLRQVDTDGSAHTTDPVSVRVEVKQELALRPPTPNPVRQSTRLAFTVKRDGPATAALYDVLGQRVRTLYDRPAQAGREHEVEVSARGLSSGTYFVRLRTPNGTRTRRVTVVR